MASKAVNQDRRLGACTVLPLLVVLSFAVFSPALSGQLVSDDINAIAHNRHVVGPLDLPAIFTQTSWWGSDRADSPGYRPLTTATFAINHYLLGNNAVAFHSVNFVLHGLVSWLVFVLALALRLERRAALAGAAIFCLLPIHTEAVAWIVGRAELLSAAAFAASLILILGYRDRGRVRTLVAAVAVFVAGLLAKENVVTLLAAPVLLAWLMPARPDSSRRRDAIAWCALLGGAAVYLGLRWNAAALGSAASGDLLDNPLSAMSSAGRLAGAIAVLGRYFWLTLWPHPLSADYSYNALAITPGFVGDRYSVVAVAVAAVLGLAAWRQRHAQPAVTFCLLLAAASYSIVSNTVVLIGTVMGERLFYLPTLGVAMAAGVAVDRALSRFGQRATALAATVAIIWTLVTMRQAALWTSAVSLFEHAVAAQPQSARARMELATAYGQSGYVDRAVEQFRAAVTIMPEYAAAWYNLGNLYARQQRLAEAADAYGRALEYAPKLTQAWFNLGLTRQLQGRLGEAENAYARTAQLAPHDAIALSSHADVLLALGRNQEAVAVYTQALAAGAPDTTALINRGVAKQRSQGCSAALPDYEAALQSDPDHQTARANAVACLSALGRHDEAQALSASAGSILANQ